MTKLTAARIRSLKEKPGLHGDGNGLYLAVSRTGSRSWIHRIMIEGRRRDIGLGGFAGGCGPGRSARAATGRVLRSSAVAVAA